LSWSDEAAEMRCRKVCVDVESTAPLHSLILQLVECGFVLVTFHIPQPY
jgi:hypothetical protein